MRPHYSQSSRENATPSSGTSPLASYKEVPPREFKTLHVRESKTVLDSGFQTVDSRLEVQGPGFFVNDSGFLQLYSGFQSQNSGLHKQKFSDSGFPHMGRKWKIHAGNFNPPAVYIKILTWHLGFTDKIANFWRFHCLVSPRRELSTMKTNPKIEIRPESLGVTYTEHGPLKPLSRSKHANRSIIALLHLVPSEGFSSRIRDKPSNKIALYIVLRYKTLNCKMI